MLRVQQCYVVECAAGPECAGVVEGQPIPLSGNMDGDAAHFTGPADPFIKELLDSGAFDDCWWRTDAEGRRWCLECVASGKAPVGVWKDHPAEGPVRPLEVACVLVECDGPACRDGAGGTGPAVLGGDAVGAYHFEGPRDSTISSAIREAGWQVRAGKLWCVRCIDAGAAPITDENHPDAELSDGELVDRYLAEQAALAAQERTHAIDHCRHEWRKTLDGFRCVGACAVTVVMHEAELPTMAGRSVPTWPPSHGMDWGRVVLVSPVLAEQRSPVGAASGARA